MSEPAPEPSPATAPIPTGWRRRVDVRPGLGRVRDSGAAIVQIVVAATAAYTFAFFVLGHQAPILAMIITVSSLGLVRDARPLRVAETVVGMLVGILVAEVLLLVAGTGWWQVALALGLTLAVARFLSPQPGFSIAAGIQSILVMVIPAGSPFERLADGAVGAVAALLTTALIPRSGTKAEKRDGRALADAMQSAANTLVHALRRGDRLRAERGLEKARALQPLVDNWRTSLESGLATARISPFLYRQRSELQRHDRIRRSMDLAARNLRVIARRVVYLTDDGRARPVIADVLADILRAAAVIADSLDDIALETAARAELVAIAAHLDPRALVPEASLGDQNLTVALRPLVVDLLGATGMPAAEARAAVPRL